MDVVPILDLVTPDGRPAVDWIADRPRGQPLIGTVKQGRHREEEAQAAKDESAGLGLCVTANAITLRLN